MLLHGGNFPAGAWALLTLAALVATAKTLPGASLEQFAAIWPKPQIQVLTGELLALDLKSVSVSCRPQPCGGVLRQAVSRFANNTACSEYRKIFGIADADTAAAAVAAAAVSASSTVRQIIVDVAEQGAELRLGMDEFYDIQAPSGLRGGEVLIRAPTQVGALHALETLAQMVVRVRRQEGQQQQGQEPRLPTGGGGGSPTTPGTMGVWLLAGNVSDWPRFPHRGLMLDSSRHFLTPAHVRSTLDALAANKLNVMHWRLAAGAEEEDPETAEAEAEADKEAPRGSLGYRMAYSREDVEGLLQYAAQRGIRLVPELGARGARYPTKEATYAAAADVVQWQSGAGPSAGVRSSESDPNSGSDLDLGVHGGAYNDEEDLDLDPEEQEELRELLAAGKIAEELGAGRKLLLLEKLFGGFGGGGGGGAVAEESSGGGAGGWGGGGGGLRAGGGGAGRMRGGAGSEEPGGQAGGGGPRRRKKLMKKKKKKAMNRKKRAGAVSGGGFGDGDGDAAYHRRLRLGRRLRYYQYVEAAAQGAADIGGGAAGEMSYVEPYLHPVVRGIGRRAAGGAGGGSDDMSHTSALRVSQQQHQFQQQQEQQRLLDQEIFRQGLQVWRGAVDKAASSEADAPGGRRTQAQELAAVTAAGFGAIMSVGWYLDGVGASEDWRRFYSREPLDFPVSSEQKARLLGGEVYMRVENPDADEADLLSGAWPRVSAVAERLWSDAGVRDESEAGARLQVHRCRLVARGIPTQPLWPGSGPSDAAAGV